MKQIQKTYYYGVAITFFCVFSCTYTDDGIKHDEYFSTHKKSFLIDTNSYFDGNVIVYGKTRLHKPTRFYDRAHFKSNVSIDHTLLARNIVIKKSVRFLDPTKTQSVYIYAPTFLTSSYSLYLPSTAPAVSQVLRVNQFDPTILEWSDMSGGTADGESANIPNTLVERDGTGSFSAQNVSVVDHYVAGNLFVQNSTNWNVGNIVKDNMPFIHDYGLDNTFIGKNAGNFTMTGTGANVGIGDFTLSANTVGTENVAIGLLALSSNTEGLNNTAVGSDCLSSNTTGYYNTAVGSGSLMLNITGVYNTAVGANALQNNAEGFNNTSVGASSLLVNTLGGSNTAVGSYALTSNTEGNNNTAVGSLALRANTTGFYNTVVGWNALSSNTQGSQNVIIGAFAGSSIQTGSNNVMIGCNISPSTVAGNNNLYIDGASLSPADESGVIRIGNTQTSCFIQGIREVTTLVDGMSVFVDSQGKLGTVASSNRFKHNIHDIGGRSSSILSLRPVSFVYASDKNETVYYGLIAEEVEKIFPALVIKDKQGAPLSVRYEMLPVLVLNEMQKQHEEINALNTTVAHCQATITALLNRIKNIEQLVANNEICR